MVKSNLYKIYYPITCEIEKNNFIEDNHIAINKILNKARMKMIGEIVSFEYKKYAKDKHLISKLESKKDAITELLIKIRTNGIDSLSVEDINYILILDNQMVLDNIMLLISVISLVVISILAFVFI